MEHEKKIVLTYNAIIDVKSTYRHVFRQHESCWYNIAPVPDIQHFNKGDEIFFSYTNNDTIYTLSFCVVRKYFSTDDPDRIYIVVRLEDADTGPELFKEYLYKNWLTYSGLNTTLHMEDL